MRMTYSLLGLIKDNKCWYADHKSGKVYKIQKKIINNGEDRFAICFGKDKIKKITIGEFSTVFPSKSSAKNYLIAYFKKSISDLKKEVRSLEANKERLLRSKS